MQAAADKIQKGLGENKKLFPLLFLLLVVRLLHTKEPVTSKVVN